MANTVFIGSFKQIITQRLKDFMQTQAVLNWKAAGGTGDIPDDVMQKAREELNSKKEAEQAVENGGNAGGPNKMLLIGGAIAAAALLILMLRK